ncbi:MAG: HD domain-containing phosphohydrolase [Bacillota bacterium]
MGQTGAISMPVGSAEELFQMLFRQSPDGVVITDATLRILEVNPAYERISGYSRAELLGQNPRILKSGRTPPGVYREMWESLETKGSWQGTFINRRKDGEVFYAFFSTMRLGDPTSPAGYIGFMRDITPLLRGEEELRRRVAELRATQRITVRTLASLAEHRDPGIEGHLDRVSHYSVLLARALQEAAEWDVPVDDPFIDTLSTASLLHDIGKVSIPEGILFKPAPLNHAERAVVELHPLIGAEILRQADERLKSELGLSQTFLTTAIEVALHHHERWDGSGYPSHLQGPTIPPSARIVALADTYDALTTRRVYRDALPVERAADVIRAGSGTQFDPRVVAAFCHLLRASRTPGADLT